jgi:hypothetical protein
MLTMLAGAALAGSDTWTGNVSSNWFATGNWLGGSVPSSSDTATFAGVPTSNQPYLGSGFPGIGTIDFQSAGWTVSAAPNANLTFGRSPAITSSGAGTNVLRVPFSDAYLSLSFQANTGNTLVLEKDYTQRRAYSTVGVGTIVFKGTSSATAQNWSYGPGVTLHNCPTVHVFNTGTVAAGGTLGGTVPLIQIYANKYGPTLIFTNGSHLSPGGDGWYGNKISTMTIRTDSTNNKGSATMSGTNSSVVIDIGNRLGSNDCLAIDFQRSDSIFYLRGCELALRGDGPLADGNYTILSVQSGSYTDTFGRVTYNGQAAQPGTFAVSYSPSSIVVSVSGMGRSGGTALMVR